jgi:hypothetical protein
MRFRWVAAVALWTMLSGPIFAPTYPAASIRPRNASPTATGPLTKLPPRR